MGHWKKRWIQTPQRILMDHCIKQAPVLSKRFWIIPWPLAYYRLELDCIRKMINFWYTFGWKWRVFVTIWDCPTHVRMTSMTSSVERTDLDFKISVALLRTQAVFMLTAKTLIRLDAWPGWSESLLGAHATLLVLSCRSSFSTVLIEIYVVGTHYNCLLEVILLSNHNICMEKYGKLSISYHQISPLSVCL